MIIAIDGPAGSGKSTVAKLVAERMGFHYLDTGAMYRAVAVAALDRGISLDDEPAIAEIAATTPVQFVHEGGAIASHVLIGDTDVTEAIRTPQADAAVSPVAKLAAVRSAMVAQQRQIGAGHNIVVEGRDIGTVVFSDAELKVFLTASAEERARRRTLQQAAVGHEVDEESVKKAIIARDDADSTRAVSPLAAAADAIQVDTTGLSIDEVVARIAELATKAAR
jgi:CMP/dCMP kinase